MNFTREPIIETIITPKDGYKLIVRNSKGSGQEEFFVDAIEVVSFGHALFFRSLERPKSFLVPVSDYEVLETRETRMVLKTAPMERGIKIGGGRNVKEPEVEADRSSILEEEEEVQSVVPAAPSFENGRIDKKRERRRHRRKKGKMVESGDFAESSSENEGESETRGSVSEKEERSSKEEEVFPIPTFATLLPPPTTLISETISKYRGNAQYRKAFFHQSEEDSLESGEEPLALFEQPPSEAESFPEVIEGPLDEPISKEPISEE